jgi:hypothetical protein
MHSIKKKKMVRPSYIGREQRGFQNQLPQQHPHLSAVGILGGGN